MAIDGECANCGKGFSEEDLNEVKDLWERAGYPGDEMPLGECPSCGALVFVVKEEDCGY